MIDEAPVPNDSFGSLFDVAGWLYPRVWASFAALWAATLLPGELLSLGFSWAMGVATPADIAAAAQAGQVLKIVAGSAGKLVIFMPAVLIHGWATMAASDAVYRGAEKTPGEVLGQVLSRGFALAWTMLGTLLRIMPLMFLGGMVAALTVRDSPLTAAACVLLCAVPVMYFMTRWMFSSMTAMFEGLSGGAALRRSAELTNRRFWMLAAQFFAYNVLVMTPSFLIGFGIAKVVPAWSARLIATAVSSLLISPFSMGLFMAMYWRESAKAVPQAPAAGPA